VIPHRRAGTAVAWAALCSQVSLHCTIFEVACVPRCGGVCGSHFVECSAASPALGEWVTVSVCSHYCAASCVVASVVGTLVAWHSASGVGWAWTYLDGWYLGADRVRVSESPEPRNDEHPGAAARVSYGYSCYGTDVVLTT
jgi:hypothetical protein